MTKKTPPKKIKDKAPPASKLDLSKTLDAFDHRNYNYYEQLSDDMKKKYAAFVLMRFMSSAPNQGGQHEYYLQMVNYFLNRDFWTLSKYPDLQHLLLCLCGTGKKTFHKWIPNKKESVKWVELFKETYKDLSDLEIKILKKNHSENDIYEIALGLGKSEKEAKEYVENFKNSKV